MFSAASKTDNVSSAANYIEDVFSTYLYTGNGSTQTITNGIDFSGKGGLLWIKNRTNLASHAIVDTARGSSNWIQTNTNNGEASNANIVTGFNSNGFGLGNQAFFANSNGDAYVSWSFRKQPKFFDVVTYTGNGANRTIAHNLGSVPGCIIIKQLSQANDWQVYHRSLANTEYLVLNSTAAKATNTALWNSTTPTSTVFSLGTDTTVNSNNATYVAYLFAHDAGGFGTAGTDNVISCGSATCDSGGIATVNLGYEPQWVLFKSSSAASDWRMLDNMRGWANNSTGNQPGLLANSSAAETTYGWTDTLSPTGFTIWGSFGQQFIYIAIRRGPMKTPTSGTSVFNAVSRTGTGATATITGPSFPPDFVQVASRSSANGFLFASRLQGNGQQMLPSNTNGEGTNTNAITTINQNGITVGTGSFVNTSGQTYINYFLGRAPGFMDVVCYAGTGVTAWIKHNLTVPPELIIVKNRTVASGWLTYAAPLGADKYLQVNSTAGSTTSTIVWDNTTPTSTQFRVYNGFNNSGYNYVGYLFASCPGVSKVGSYSGTGSTQTISCGFAARFVMIKRTDSTGDWYVYDTTRGMVAGTDPYLLYNTTGAEVNQNDVYTNASGFQLVSGNAGTNASGGSYIYLAIA